MSRTGNTDTIHYWNVSPNIYRFSPARAGTRFGIHTINERVDINAHIEGMRVYYDLIRNFDRADV
jgi:Gly-Xaa carboxypeptidase